MDSKNGYGIRKAKSASISGSFVKNEMEKQALNSKNAKWPERPEIFPDLMTPIEAAMFLRLDQTGHNPKSACRTLNYWRERDELKATKYARHVWYLKKELVRFLENKTREGV
jgi:hypothetical protein